MRPRTHRALRLLPDIIAGALAGPLAVAGIAKISTPTAAQDWPVSAGPLGPPHGPRLVGAAETAVAATAALAPGRSGAAAPLLAYSALAAYAHRTRGARCACFGTARLAAIGRLHVGLNAVAAAAAAAAAALGPGRRPLLRTSAGAVSAAVTLASVLALDRRSAAREARAAAECARPIHAVRLYVSEQCPACRSLSRLVDFMEPARREGVRTTVIAADERLPVALADLGVPCAVGLDAMGDPVCAPAGGIGGVKSLIDGITLGAPDHAHAG